MPEVPYHRIVGSDLIIGVGHPSDDDINYAMGLLRTFRHREFIEGKLKENMILEVPDFMIGGITDDF